MSAIDSTNSDSLILDPVPVRAPKRKTVTGIRPMLAHMGASAWIVVDMILAVSAIAIAYSVNPYFVAISQTGGHLDPSWHTIMFSLAVISIAHVFGLHDPLRDRETRGMVIKFFFVIGIASLLVIAAALFVFFERVGRHALIVSGASAWVLLVGSRLTFWRLTRQHRQRIGLLGEDGFCAAAERFFGSQSRPIAVRPFEAASSDLGDWALEHKLDEVVVHGAAPITVHQQLLDCLDRGIPVISYSEFLEQHYQLVPVDEIDSRWFLNAAMEGVYPHYRIAKRLADITVGLLGLILASPLILLSAILIKLGSRGPVFYSQTRVGLHNRRFRIYKLRTMCKNAETNGEAKWATEGDSRVTWIGKILRKTRLDEVPQFLNILKGEMAFIGPRPERPEFTEDLAQQIPFYAKRHMVKPGLTGWAQINYPYGACVEDARNKLKYDLFYVKHASLELDLHIIIRTVGAIMKGAR
ncbi:MAG: exopolysaccharide biosynthesis polyprenyl glycosylphosphotransferase [Verrucomicrobiales bacterium]|jgi:exopolysaccharide biosynthesis polyprenyl glycosylphosphotransferase